MVEVIALLATWLIAYLLHSTLLLGGAWLSERRKLPLPPAVREFVWRVALVGGVLTATLQLGMNALDLPRPRFLPPAATVLLRAPRDLAPAETGITPAVALRGAPQVAPSLSSVAAVAAPPIVPPTPRPSPRHVGLGTRIATVWPCALCVLWLLAAAFAAVRLGLLARLARRELPDRVLDASSPLHQRLLTLCASQTGAAPRLTRSASLAGPISLPNGEICVPDWVVTALTPGQQQALLAHELAHLRRRDPQWLLFARLLETLLIGQPLNGLARRRLAALAEIGADAWAARAVGDPRSLAECLAACAERLVPGRAPRFGTAMADRSSLVERVQRLVQGLHLQSERIPRSLRIGVLILVVAVGVLVPVIVVRAGDRHSTRTSISVDEDLNGHRLRAKISWPGYLLKGTLDGEIGFDDSETEVASMGAGAVFELEETQSGSTRRVRLESGDGTTIQRRYWLEGVERPLDDAGNAWLAKAIPVLLRATTRPEVRVKRLLTRSGVSAVLDEIATIDDDYNRSRYLAALIAARPLTTTEFALALQCAEKIGSDYERRNALRGALAQATDPVCQTAILTAAKGMSGDYETAELLTAAASKLGVAPEPWDAWFTIADGVGSDFELRRSYEALLKNRQSPPSAVARLLRDAGAHFDSDFELREVLAGTVPRLGGDPSLVTAYASATRDIGADFERGQALHELLSGIKLDAAGCGQVLEVIATMGSDFERSRALVTLAKQMPADPALLAQYRSVARSLSVYERGQAEQALDHLSR
jgi:beta-lactamase regulating signal transducer with metallopeptidase domain